MAERRVRAGQSIVLRARFQDDLGDGAEASNVWIRIYPPDVDTGDTSEAFLLSGDASYFDQGIFQYTYAVPSDGPDGIWNDQWHGRLNGQDLYTELSFEVSASGIITSLANQLNNNNFVEVTLYSGIAATDGGTLEEDYSFTFLTTTSPTYSNIRKVRLDYGGYVSDIIDETLQLALLEASLEADELTFATSQNEKVYHHARREWVTCKAALVLLSNLGNQSLRSKTLGDLSVTYDTQGLRDAMSKAVDCMSKWEPQLMTGGYAKAAQQPQMVIKGDFDPDRPTTGRDWHSTSAEPTPAANTKARDTTQRRYKSIFGGKKRYW